MKGSEWLSRRDFLKNLSILAAWTAIVWGTGKYIYNTLTETQGYEQTFFDEKYYIEPLETQAELVERGVLFEQMPTAYDNILYAQDIHLKPSRQKATIAKTCQRIENIDKKIAEYSTRYNIPYSKLVWLVMLESAGKAHAGKKNGCYGYTQLSKLMGETYGAIITKEHRVWRRTRTTKQDKRDNIDYALDATCKYLTHMHDRYKDDNRSITFAAYHMGETHMNKIMHYAREVNPEIKNIQDIVEIKDRKLSTKLMDLQDESYKYYPKLLAAWRIYKTYKNNRSEFKEQIKQYVDMPITRKPSLAEEYPRFGDKQYNTAEDMKKAMEEWELYGVKIKKEDNKVHFKKIGEYTNSQEVKELMKMTTKAWWWLILLLISHLDTDITINSLTRSQAYNDRVYHAKWNTSAKNKRTSHATGMTVDLWLPRKKEDLLYVKYILYTLELQGKISFLKESDHFHININPKFKKYFESIADGEK